MDGEQRIKAASQRMQYYCYDVMEQRGEQKPDIYRRLGTAEWDELAAAALGGTQKCEETIVDRLKRELAKPLGREEGWVNPDHFDPWNLFEGMIYGSYSSEFDDMAILVIDNILNNRRDGESLAHEMFREMLCNVGLCTYGTSPRGCFPNYVDGVSTEPLLKALVAKWREFREVAWSE